MSPTPVMTPSPGEGFAASSSSGSAPPAAASAPISSKVPASKSCSMRARASSLPRSRWRLTRDAHFVFGSVAPNPYRLWGFLDVDSNFDPNVDVLAQAGAGDRVASGGSELNLQPGQTLSQDVKIAELVSNEPPGFRLQDD